MAESYADEQRRRNGLVPQRRTEPSPDALWDALVAFEAQPERIQAARERLAGSRAELLTVPDATVTFTADATAASRALDRLAKEFDLRCTHTDLPPAMCHHCKEKRDADAH